MTRVFPSPLRNVWLGFSAEDQQAWNQRRAYFSPRLAAVQFASCEPLLEELDLGLEHEPTVDWVIAGGESGHGARPCDVDWIRSLVRQCHNADVPCFVKQLGAQPRIEGRPLFLYDAKAKGNDPQAWPSDLRGCRAFPE
jgi:protein gp37